MKWNQTIVHWKFSLEPVNPTQDQRIFVPKTSVRRRLILGEIVITSLLDKMPNGRCVHLNILGKVEGGANWGISEFLSLRTLCRLGVDVREDPMSFGYLWKLRPNEPFLDGALRIGELVFKTMGARCESDCYSHKTMLANFTVIQKTFIVKHYSNGDLKQWIPLEHVLRLKRGWVK